MREQYFAVCEFVEGDQSDQLRIIHLNSFSCPGNADAWVNELLSKIGQVYCDLVFMIFKGTSPKSYAKGVIHRNLSVTVEKG